MDENDVPGSRTRYTDHQLQRLEEAFSEHPFITSDQTALLSQELDISLKQTRTWFQNRRAKLRRRAIKAEGKNYVPKLSPGSIRICRTPPSPSRGTDKMAPAAQRSDGVLKPSNGNYGDKLLSVPPFTSDSRSPSESPAFSSADEDDVFLSDPSRAGDQRPERKDITAELSKSAPTGSYMEAARGTSAQQWQPPFPTFFGTAGALAGDTGLVGQRSSSLPRCSGPMGNYGSDDVGSRHWCHPPAFVVEADSSERHSASSVSWPSAQGREQTTSTSSVTSLIIDMENSSVTRDADSSLETSTSLVQYFLSQDNNDA
ncbi:unnamed protein product [Ixodes hexagonus]